MYWRAAARARTGSVSSMTACSAHSHFRGPIASRTCAVFSGGVKYVSTPAVSSAASRTICGRNDPSTTGASAAGAGAMYGAAFIRARYDFMNSTGGS